MDADWRPVQGSNPPDGGGDWRAQLDPEARSRIVNRALESLKKHFPLSEPERIDELRRTAVLFEEKIYIVATSQPDYLRKLATKILSMEKDRQHALGNAQGIPNQNNPGQG